MRHSQMVVRRYAEGGLPLPVWMGGPGSALPPMLRPHRTARTLQEMLCHSAPAFDACCAIFLECPFPPLYLLGWVHVGTLRAGLLALTPRGWPHRFNKLAVGSVVESAFRRLKHLQVLDIEGNFEFGDVSKDRGRLKEEEEEDEEDEEDKDEEEEERR